MTPAVIASSPCGLCERTSAEPPVSDRHTARVPQEAAVPALPGARQPTNVLKSAAHNQVTGAGAKPTAAIATVAPIAHSHLGNARTFIGH